MGHSILSLHYILLVELILYERGHTYCPRFGGHGGQRMCEGNTGEEKIAQISFSHP